MNNPLDGDGFCEQRIKNTPLQPVSEEGSLEDIDDFKDNENQDDGIPKIEITEENERSAGEEEHAVHFEYEGDDSDHEDSGNGDSDPTAEEWFTPDPPDGGYGWVICACAFVHQMIADGILFSFGVVYVSLLEDFKSGKSETSWVGAVLMGTSMMTGPLAGAVASRYSLRTAGIAGSLIAATGLAASYFAPSILILTFTYGIICGTGTGFIFLTSILACNIYFRKRRALANGIVMCGSGVGVFILSPVLAILIEKYNWQGALLCLSGLALNGCVAATLYRQPPLKKHEPLVFEESSHDSGIEPYDDEQESHVDRCSSIVNKHLNIAQDVDEFSSMTSFGSKNPRGSMNLHTMKSVSQGRNLHELNAISSHSLYRSGYWDHIQPKELSHMDLCQIGSMLTLPTVHSMRENGLTHSRNAMTVEEKQSYMFWRYNNYECSSAAAAICRTLSCHLLRNPVMVLLVISGMFWTGQSTTYMFFYDYATNVGVSDQKSALLLSAIGITNTIGRILVGLVTDSPKVNSTLVYILSIALAGAVNIVLPFVDNYVILMGLATIFGLAMASYVSLRSIVIVDTMGIDNLAGALGLVVMFQGFAFTIVPPISGAILEATLTFKGPFIACGICYFIAACIMIPIFVRYFRARKHFVQA